MSIYANIEGLVRSSCLFCDLHLMNLSKIHFKLNNINVSFDVSFMGTNYSLKTHYTRRDGLLYIFGTF